MRSGVQGPTRQRDIEVRQACGEAFGDLGLRHDLRASLEQGLRKVVLWTDKHGAASAAFEDDAFFNINTPDDLAQAERML